MAVVFVLMSFWTGGLFEGGRIDGIFKSEASCKSAKMVIERTVPSRLDGDVATPLRYSCLGMDLKD